MQQSSPQSFDPLLVFGIGTYKFFFISFAVGIAFLLGSIPQVFLYRTTTHLLELNV